jgi:hypothetical protein
MVHALFLDVGWSKIVDVAEPFLPQDHRTYKKFTQAGTISAFLSTILALPLAHLSYYFFTSRR